MEAVMTKKIGVVGAGNWGTALAKLLTEKNEDVTIWCYEPEVAKGINTEHHNPLYLTNIKLPHNLRATNDLKEAIAGKEFVVSVVPSHAVRGVWTKGAAYLESSSIFVSATKGIEVKTQMLISEVLSQCLPSHSVSRRTFLSGPSFAREVAMGLPTSVVIAGTDTAVTEAVQKLFRTISFLPFTNEDITGVELGGAIKNVVAIAAGVSDGLGFGHNARAAIITRGVYEMVKIGKVLGAKPLTFLGLAGIGDLVLTCTAEISRNHTVGKKLGMGQPLKTILSDMNMVAEGVPTSDAVHKLMSKHGIEAPICEATYRMLYEALSPRDAVTWLCSMPLKDELRAIMK